MKGNAMRISAFLLCLVCLLCLGGCSNSQNLSKNFTAQADISRYDTDFGSAYNSFALSLFASATLEDENTLVSPLSVATALSMAANGTKGQTLREIEDVMGADVDSLNNNLRGIIASLPSDNGYSFKLANSIWLRDDPSLVVKENFLQTGVDIFGAEVFKSPFDGTTANDINKWVKSSTDGMIDAILDRISENTVMYLINALAFDAEWDSPYESGTVRKRDFNTADGRAQPVEMMHSEEAYYIDTSRATGFIKPYEGGKYSFVALLPREDITVSQYVSSLQGNDLAEIISSAREETVSATCPKFDFDYSVNMNDTLKHLGMATAFDQSTADFTKMATSIRGNIYVGNVVHKTHITVDERGTKAAAATMVQMKSKGANVIIEYRNIVMLDRPFVFAIIDNQHNIPLFLGTVCSVQ